MIHHGNWLHWCSKSMLITITKSNKLRAAIFYSYCPAIDTSSASLNRNRTKIEVIEVLLRLLHLPNNWYTMTASQEVASDNTSNTRTTRRTLAGRTPQRKQLAYGTAERLTFTTAPERQDEHYQAARRPGAGAPRWYNLRCTPYSTHTRPCPCLCTNCLTAPTPGHGKGRTDCLTAPTPGHGKGRTDSNCLTALEMLQLSDGCSLQYQGGRGWLI